MVIEWKKEGRNVLGTYSWDVFILSKQRRIYVKDCIANIFTRKVDQKLRYFEKEHWIQLAENHVWR